MLALGPSSSDVLRVTTGSAADVEVSCSYVEYDVSVPPVVQDVDGITLASITGVATTTILAGTTGRKRIIKDTAMFNRSATSTTVLVEHFDGTNPGGGIFCTLLQNESFKFTESGIWIHYDANGAPYPSSGNVASQAEMEAATALDKYVPPGRVHLNPGVAKFVAMTCKRRPPTT
jgi:hypothetical protein